MGLLDGQPAREHKTPKSTKEMSGSYYPKPKHGVADTGEPPELFREEFYGQRPEPENVSPLPAPEFTHEPHDKQAMEHAGQSPIPIEGRKQKEKTEADAQRATQNP